jgi:outer membrane protein TolC
MRKLTVLFLLFSWSVIGQNSQEVPAELSAAQFVQWVDANHPVLAAVRNKLPIAKAELLKARGAFDPAIVGNYASKEYKGDLYYEMPSLRLALPTASPVDLMIDWNAIDGINTNPQNKLPDEGLFAVGGMINLGNGLMTDERRTALRMAKAAVDLTEAEAQLYRNKLLAYALSDYWKWYEAYASLKAYENAVVAAVEVYEFTINAFNAGDAAAIDTLDAQALLSTWQTDYFKARNKAIKAMYTASNWLWSLDGQPMLLNPESRPAALMEALEVPLELAQDHPLFIYNDSKEEQFRLKRQLAREYLKPKVAVGGAVLMPGNFSELPTSDDFDVNNRMIKAKLDMPLFLRTGRGYSRSQNLQLQNFQLERSETENSWKNALSAAAEGILQLEVALNASLKNQESLRLLLEAEKRKLELGDSELIKVNLRKSYYAKALIRTASITRELGVQKALWQELSASF